MSNATNCSNAGGCYLVIALNKENSLHFPFSSNKLWCNFFRAVNKKDSLSFCLQDSGITCSYSSKKFENMLKTQFPFQTGRKRLHKLCRSEQKTDILSLETQSRGLSRWVWTNQVRWGNIMSHTTQSPGRGTRRRFTSTIFVN